MTIALLLIGIGALCIYLGTRRERPRLRPLSKRDLEKYDV